MFRKVVILILIIILIFLSFIFYKKANKYKLPKQYKIEIEQLINEEAPKTKKEIDKITQDVKNDVEKYKKNPSGYSRDKLIDLVSIPENYINTPRFYFYSKLIDTTDKYTRQKSDLPTDFVIDLIEYVYPYLIKNNINMEKINEIDDYTNNQRSIIEEYLKDIEIPDED